MLRIEYPYDDAAPDGSLDRNLWGHRVIIDGRRLDIEDARYKRYNDVSLPGQSGLFWAGALVFTLTSGSGSGVESR